MRIPKSAARKRRLAVLRQISSSDGEDPVGFSESGFLDRLPDEERDFVAACGASLPLRLSVRNERSGEIEDVLIERPWAVIGGAETCDLRVLHPDISQRHTYLQFAAGRLFCCDLASRTGTHWSTESPSRGWLIAGEPIYLGPYSIRPHPNDFVAEGAADRSAELANPGDDFTASECPPVAFTVANFLGRSGRPKIRRIRRTVTLAGASQACPLRLQHASVGRVHCSFVWTPCGLWVVDLLCAGGTLVNGQLVSLAHLSEGDEVAIGRFQLRVTYAPPSDDELEPASEADSAGAMTVAAPRGLRDSVSPVDSSITTSVPQPAPPIVFAAADSEPLPDETALHSPSAPAIDVPPKPANGLMEFRPAPLQLPPDDSLSEPVALAMMQQFSAMQQQLFDHTQQLLAAMSQAFSAAHTRQLELIRGELFRVHEVNCELQELNLELTMSRQLPSEGRVSSPRSEPARPVALAPLREPRSGSPRSARDEPRPPRTGHGRSDAPGHEGRGHEGRGLDPPAPQAGVSRAGLNARLSDRIEELEQERTNRWQKIMQILAPAGEPG